MRNWGFRLWREPVGQDDDDDVDGNDTNTILADYARTMFDIEHEESETTLVDLMERNPVESIPEASSKCGRLSFCVCVCVIFVRVMLVKLNLKIRFWRCFVTVNTTPIHIYPKYTLPRQVCCCEKWEEKLECLRSEQRCIGKPMPVRRLLSWIMATKIRQQQQQVYTHR